MLGKKVDMMLIFVTLFFGVYAIYTGIISALSTGTAGRALWLGLILMGASYVMVRAYRDHYNQLE
jgi:hypothetical protein